MLLCTLPFSPLSHQIVFNTNTSTMRAGSTAIQQTLTPEAAAVLNHSIAESARRNHGQTTPLHVAATLLSSPSGYLRQACIRSHPNSSHPLQCRALELCFSVALERLPSALSSPAPPGMEPEPLISNALMAALKRAQAHQRRGCSDQQQPLLAVKVELDQLIVSILDDPGVSRVMREAGFLSPAVKSAVEQSLTSPSPNATHHLHRPIAPRLYYLNPGGPIANTGITRGDEINKLLEIMLRSKKRNPILVGDFSEPGSVVRELLRKIESNQEHRYDVVFKNVRVISIDKNSVILPSKIKELEEVIASLIGIGGVILDLGDLRWLVDHQHQQQGITERGREVVSSMAELLARFENGIHKVWLIGTANCETYLRCQIYYSTMECDWDLQAVPLAPTPMFPRLGADQFSSNLSSLQIPPPSLAWQRATTFFCPQCSENYEKELSKLESFHESFSKSKDESAQPSLPQWLQNAKLDRSHEKDHGIISEQKTKELKKKWRDTCLHLHPSFHQISFAERLSLRVTPPFFQPLQLNTNNKVNNFQLTDSPPMESSVQTDLVLGRKEPKDFCISSDKFANSSDTDKDTYKNLRKKLMENVWWQPEAASSVASAIARCRLGNIWLLFAGPDRAGKEKMVSTLAKELCGSRPITISLGNDGESVRGRTTIDRIAEVVRRNPSSVIMIDCLDEAGEILQGSIKQAIEGGRIRDSYGREVSIGNVVIVLSGDWSSSSNSCRDQIGSGGWKLKLVVEDKNTKNCKNSKVSKKRRITDVSFDLNLGLTPTDGSNSSDLTVDNEFLITLVPHDLVESVDEFTVFKPIDSGFFRREIKKVMSVRFSEIVGSLLEVGDEVLEKIQEGILYGETRLEEWVEKVLAPSFVGIKTLISSDCVVRLVLVEPEFEPGERGGDWLPENILL